MDQRLHNGAAPAPFLTKTYDIVDDPSTDNIVSWSPSGISFIVCNLPEFCQRLLPRYFKHCNFFSFVRQLNTYGFRKIDPDRWEFANGGFLRGQRQLLHEIQRRRSGNPQQQEVHAARRYYAHMESGVSPFNMIEMGKFGIEGEIGRLKRDKHVLMMEVVKLGQELQSTERDMRLMWDRLHATEQRQQQMASFLAKAAQNGPAFIAQIMQQQQQQQYHNSDENGDSNKRRRLTCEYTMASYSSAGHGAIAHNMNIERTSGTGAPPAVQLWDKGELISPDEVYDHYHHDLQQQQQLPHHCRPHLQLLHSSTGASNSMLIRENADYLRPAMHSAILQEGYQRDPLHLSAQKDSYAAAQEYYEIFTREISIRSLSPAEDRHVPPQYEVGTVALLGSASLHFTAFDTSAHAPLSVAARLTGTNENEAYNLNPHEHQAASVNPHQVSGSLMQGVHTVSEELHFPSSWCSSLPKHVDVFNETPFCEQLNWP